MFALCCVFLVKVKVGNDQEKAHSERDSKHRGGEKLITFRYLYYGRVSSYFPNRWPLSYIHLTENMKTYIRNLEKDVHVCNIILDSETLQPDEM